MENGKWKISFILFLPETFAILRRITLLRD